MQITAVGDVRFITIQAQQFIGSGKLVILAASQLPDHYLIVAVYISN